MHSGHIWKWTDTRFSLALSGKAMQRPGGDGTGWEKWDGIGAVRMIMPRKWVGSAAAVHTES